MSSVVISGDTSGSVTLQAPAVAGSTVLTLPATSGTVITTTSGTAPSATTATTATNLAGGSNGTIPYQSASGTTQMLAVGTSGQVLQSNGTSAPTWVTPSAGAMTLISTQTVSATTAISWTGLSGYSQYILIIKNIYFSSNDFPIIQIGTGASPTWVTSSYSWTLLMNYGQDGGSSSGNSYGNQGTTGFTNGVGLSLASALGSSTTSSNGNILISNLNTSGPIQFSSQFAMDSGGYSRYFAGSGYWANATALSTTAIRLLSQGGLTITGSASLYGISS